MMKIFLTNFVLLLLFLISKSFFTITASIAMKQLLKYSIL